MTGTNENKVPPHMVLRTAGSRDYSGNTLSTHSSFTCARKKCREELGACGIRWIGARIVSSFLGRNEMGLGGAIKIGDYSGELLDKDFFNISLNFDLGRNSGDLLEML
jgi:hypothetical protein